MLELHATLCLCAVGSAAAQDPAAAIDQFVERRWRAFAVPGLAAAVVRDGEVLFAKGFGVRTLGEESPVDDRTRFHLASVSKTFVATAVMQLADAGALELDRPVSKYLPRFRVADPRDRAITVRQLLTHTSGMPDTDEYGWDRPKHDEGALGRYVAGLSDLELLSEPGTAWSYSNIGYEVLGHLVAVVSKQTFESYVATRVLEPLGMSDSTFVKSDVDPAHLAAPHVGPGRGRVSAIYPYNREHAPSSTLHSNLRDLCRWMIAMLDAGELDGNRVLSADRLADAWRPQFHRGKGRFMGIGWFLDDVEEGRVVHHSGSDVGFRTNLMLLPEEGVGVVVLANHGRAPVAAIARSLLLFAAGHRELSDAAPRVPVGLFLEPVRLQAGIDRAMTRLGELRPGELRSYDHGSSALLTYARELSDCGRPADAVVVMRRVRDLEPGHPLSHRELGRMLFEAESYDDARTSAERALELAPNDRDARDLLGRIQAKLRKR